MAGPPRHRTAVDAFLDSAMGDFDYIHPKTSSGSAERARRRRLRCPGSGGELGQDQGEIVGCRGGVPGVLVVQGQEDVEGLVEGGGHERGAGVGVEGKQGAVGVPGLGEAVAVQQQALVG
nr:hypothetical protein [Streptomyces violens]